MVYWDKKFNWGIIAEEYCALIAPVIAPHDPGWLSATVDNLTPGSRVILLTSLSDIEYTSSEIIDPIKRPTNPITIMAGAIYFNFSFSNGPNLSAAFLINKITKTLTAARAESDVKAKE